MGDVVFIVSQQEMFMDEERWVKGLLTLSSFLTL